MHDTGIRARRNRIGGEEGRRGLLAFLSGSFRLLQASSCLFMAILWSLMGHALIFSVPLWGRMLP